MTTLYLVLPCYNEEEVLPETARQLKAVIGRLQEEKRISEDSRVVFVDDGSKDATWQLITQFHIDDSLFTGLKLTRNRGHQNALLAGLLTVRDRADAVLSMDADLQDDPASIPAFLDAFEAGNDIVYGVRSDRSSDTFFKRTTAQGYYKTLRSMGVDVVYNHADCRLMSRRALDLLAQYPETNLFLRGMVPQIGLPAQTITYPRQERFAGKSKYPLKKMLKLAFDGITSFSLKPLGLLMGLTVFFLLMGVGLLLGGLIAFLCGAEVSALIWLFGGLSLFASVLEGSLWLVGAYVGRAYMEVKHRPRFFIEQYLDRRGTSSSESEKHRRQAVSSVLFSALGSVFLQQVILPQQSQKFLQIGSGLLRRGVELLQHRRQNFLLGLLFRQGLPDKRPHLIEPDNSVEMQDRIVHGNQNIFPHNFPQDKIFIRLHGHAAFSSIFTRIIWLLPGA